MKKAASVVLATLFFGLFVIACGGDSKKSCTASLDCDPGEVCVETVCEVRPCNTKADCGVGEICVAAELVNKPAGVKYCTAPLCEDPLRPCADATKVCENGICVDKTIPGDTIEDATDDATRDTLEETAEDVPELPPVEDVKDCATCQTNTDCGTGYSCQPVGAEKHCLRDCNNDGNCLSGYTCYASGTSKSCLPVSYNCVACAFDTPCGEGSCCDLSSGSCKTCKAECDTCTYDYDCGEGLRCYKKSGDPSGVCVPECSNGTCADSEHYTCQDNSKGVKLCVPTTDGCKGCEDPTPFPLDDGTCVECRSNDDCGSEKPECDTSTHTCVNNSCPSGLKKCESDGQCHQCCVDDDCLAFPESTGVCLPEGNCEGVTACGGLCTEDFPVCAVVQGVEQCVQCKVDADCALVGPNCTCAGDPIYSCVDAEGAICQKEGSCSAMCTTDADCPPASTGAALSCAQVGGSGICYDSTGSCDGMSACCAPGQKCFDLIVLIFGVMGGAGMPGMEIPSSGSGYCSCEEDNPCLNGKACTDMSIICVLGSLLGQLGALVELVCPGGQLSDSMPKKLCVDFADLLGGIF